MQLYNSHILFTSRLLCLDQPRRIIDAHNEAARHFGVQRARMPRLIHLQYLLNPGDNLVRGRVRGLVQIDHTVVLQHVDGPVCGRVATGERREMTGLHVQLVEVLCRQ